MTALRSNDVRSLMADVFEPTLVNVRAAVLDKEEESRTPVSQSEVAAAQTHVAATVPFPEVQVSLLTSVKPVILVVVTTCS